MAWFRQCAGDETIVYNCASTNGMSHRLGRSHARCHRLCIGRTFPRLPQSFQEELLSPCPLSWLQPWLGSCPALCAASFSGWCKKLAATWIQERIVPPMAAANHWHQKSLGATQWAVTRYNASSRSLKHTVRQKNLTLRTSSGTGLSELSCSSSLRMSGCCCSGLAITTGCCSTGSGRSSWSSAKVLSGTTWAAHDNGRKKEPLSIWPAAVREKTFPTATQGLWMDGSYKHGRQVLRETDLLPFCQAAPPTLALHCLCIPCLSRTFCLE